MTCTHWLPLKVVFSFIRDMVSHQSSSGSHTQATINRNVSRGTLSRNWCSSFLIGTVTNPTKKLPQVQDNEPACQIFSIFVKHHPTNLEPPLRLDKTTTLHHLLGVLVVELKNGNLQRNTSKTQLLTICHLEHLLYFDVRDCFFGRRMGNQKHKYVVRITS